MLVGPASCGIYNPPLAWPGQRVRRTRPLAYSHASIEDLKLLIFVILPLIFGLTRNWGPTRQNAASSSFFFFFFFFVAVARCFACLAAASRIAFCASLICDDARSTVDPSSFEDTSWLMRFAT